MNSGQRYCFTHSSGEVIYLFVLGNVKGHEVLISNYGATIMSLKLKKSDGTMNDIVLGFDKVEDYLSEKYMQQYIHMGCAVGRYANRIRNASCMIDGKKTELSKNMGEDQLHGGISGFGKKVWKVLSFNASKNELLLNYKSPDGEEGFPGNLDVNLKFRLSEEELLYQYEATTDRPTIINLTHHSYFNLNNGKGNDFDYLVKIEASEILEQNDRLIPTGIFLKVENTEFDFRKRRKVGDQSGMKDGYDKSFVLDKKKSKLKLAAEAYCEQSHTCLQVFTTEPVLHFYSGKGIPHMHGKNGSSYGPYSGFCFETHKHPNAVNIPQFPNTILRPGEKYNETTVYRFFEA
ncbi:MAG: galactose mutarotase [Chitinophagaceae bacterium]|nr:galactose mutarotase [Chitinophagaceae bacterium]